MPVELKPNAEPVEGYRLTRYLGRGGFGEVWEATAPGGLAKAVKFSALETGDPDAHCRELEGLQKIRSIRHPYLLSIERFEVVENYLIIVMELADKNLADRFEECVQGNYNGIPREELLRYVREAAEVLDLMNQQHGLQHLDIKPENLFLCAGHIKVADFGLVQPRNTNLSRASLAISPPYAPPELFDGRVEPTADQYSLAVTYQELLTGARPYSSTDVRGLIFQHLRERPDLSLLPAGDRPIVGRALQRDVNQRFTSCTEFVEALSRVAAFGIPTVEPKVIVPARPSPAAPVDGKAATPAGAAPRPQFVIPRTRPKEKTRPIGAKSTGTVSVEMKRQPAPHEPDELHATFLAFLPPEIYEHKIRGFITGMKAEIVSMTEDKTVMQFCSRGFFGFGGKTIFLQLDTYCRNPASGYRVVDVSVWTSSKELRGQELVRRGMLLIRYLKSYLMATETGGARAVVSEARMRQAILG